MAPPKLIHLYMDNFWKFFGQVLGCLDYRADVVVEHMHYMAGKSQADEQYLDVNSKEMYENDKKTYMEYVQTDLKHDLEMLVVGLGLVK